VCFIVFTCEMEIKTYFDRYASVCIHMYNRHTYIHLCMHIIFRAQLGIEYSPCIVLAPVPSVAPVASLQLQLYLLPPLLLHCSERYHLLRTLVSSTPLALTPNSFCSYSHKHICHLCLLVSARMFCQPKVPCCPIYV
jgi:hypothetical protein